LRPGGFGILLAKQVVDEMFYNEHRNEVLLIKHLAPYRDEEGNAVLR
jgi:anti-sigma regulatory factor (Ser/Thr protein kinase)